MRLAFGTAAAAAAAEADSVFPERAFSLLPPPQKRAAYLELRPPARLLSRSLGPSEELNKLWTSLAAHTYPPQTPIRVHMSDFPRFMKGNGGLQVKGNDLFSWYCEFLA